MAREYFPEKIVEIPVRNIDPAPGPYCMSYITDLSKLERSIEQVGLMHLPCVVKDDKGRWDIVTGYRRLQAVRNRGGTSVSCIDLSEKKQSSLQLLLFNFYDNLPTRAFNLIEKGMFLNRLRRYLDKEEILASYMPLLELPAYDEILEIYIGLDCLEAPYREAVARGGISMKALGLLNMMKKDDKTDTLDIILKLGFNKNQQVRFIEYIRDLSVMEERPAGRILSEPELREIIDRENDNVPQQARQVIDYLKSKRSPRLTETENRLRTLVARLNLPTGSRIKNDPSFEAEDLCLEILFEDGPDLLSKLKALANSRELAAFRGVMGES